MPPHEDALNLRLFFSDLASTTLSAFPVKWTVFVFTEGLSVMTCCVLVLAERRIVALHEPNRVRPCPDWLLLSPGVKKKTFLFPFLSPFFTLNCTCLMSWHLLYSFYTHLLLSNTSLPCPLSLFLVSLFLLHPMFFLLAFTMLQKGLRKSTILCYQETFSTTVLHILGAHIPCPIFHAKGMRYARKKKKHCSRSNNGGNERSLSKLGLTDLCPCKNDSPTKQHILHFNLSTRIVLIRAHRHLKWILCVEL